MATAKQLAISLGLASTLTFTAMWEGDGPRRGGLNYPYLDTVGVATICKGHTGKDVTMSMLPVSDAQCEEWHALDVIAGYKTVRQCVTVPLSEGERTAWSSFALNVGPGGKGRKDGMCMLLSGAVPSHVRLLNQGRRQEACAMLMQWTKAGGVESRGIRNRRIDEVRQCVKDLK